MENAETTGRQLLILGCSATKISAKGLLPAISLYDGPAFRVLRSFLREYRWPNPLSLAILSAKHGIIGGISHLTHYDQRMTPQRATNLSQGVTSALLKLVPSHRRTHLVMGQDYLRAISWEALNPWEKRLHFAKGSIGFKLNYLHDILRTLHSERRRPREPLPQLSRPLYFLPDWDDFLDTEYNFLSDRFSSATRSIRRESHSIELMRPQKLCDGVLVSLAQHLGSKGFLKRVGVADEDSLAPKSVRDHFKLQEDQWAFGDCGAFSYIAEETPTISVEQAVSLYDLYEFDLGASVDHIPVPEFFSTKGKRRLSKAARLERVRLTRDNADYFIRIHRGRAARFIPVGVIQGLDADGYSTQIGDYFDMGYKHIALGGLVPRSDKEILSIVEAVDCSMKKLKSRPWLHLLGIFRPSLQAKFRHFRVGSFDSATYFRKAWLRSDQNYLGVDSNWYAAIRVPPTSDSQTMGRLLASGVSEKRILKLETDALSMIRLFDQGKVSAQTCVDAILRYDRLLTRADLSETRLANAYRRTLEARPWKLCQCPMCKDLGIDILVFRGLNRNKRRGAHNTLQLFRLIANGKEVGDYVGGTPRHEQ